MKTEWYPAIAQWLKDGERRTLEITWGDMTGRWHGHEETKTGFIVTLYENRIEAGSSAPHESAEESLQIVNDMLANNHRLEDGTINLN